MQRAQDDYATGTEEPASVSRLLAVSRLKERKGRLYTMARDLEFLCLRRKNSVSTKSSSIRHKRGASPCGVRPFCGGAVVTYIEYLQKGRREILPTHF